MDIRVDSVKVTRPVSVADVEGFELNGPLGVSRLAWRGNALVAESSAGLRFSPPIPLLAPDGKEATWHGRVTWLGAEKPASATVRQSKRTLTLASRPIETTQSDLTLSLPSRKIELITCFEPGVGIVQQEQRSGGKLEVEIEMVSGP
jgi:hypothetical protein